MTSEPWVWVGPAILGLAVVAAEVALFVTAMLRIARSGESGTAKAIWVLICLCFPIVGSAVALFVLPRPTFSV